MADPVTTTEHGSVDQSVERNGRSSTLSTIAAWAGSDRRMFGALVVLASAWTVILGRLTLLRHNRFGTFDFDAGIQDQLIWQLAHLRQFGTVRGVPFLGNHASFGFLLLAPFTWLGAGNNAWNLINTVALASASLVLYGIAKDKIGRPWMSLLIGVAWLAQPSVQWWVHEGFHPECVALPFLFATFRYGEQIVARQTAGIAVDRKLKWMFIGSGFATIIWKEDLALALVGMGAMWIVRRHWRLGAKVLVVSALWFAVFGAWMVPHFAGGTVYGGIYGDLGNKPSEVLVTTAEHPSRMVRRLDDNDAIGYSRKLHESYGFVTLLSPSTWLIGAPQWTIDIVSTADFTWDMKNHYQAIPLGALALSFVEGVALLYRRRRILGQGLLGVGLACALALGQTSGPAPWGAMYRQGYWPLYAAPTQHAKEQAVRMVPSGAGVSADYLMVPHLSHRQIIYSFPNPWININYGILPTDHGSPAAVQWLVVDTGLFNERDLKLFAEIRASGEFVVALQDGPVMVLRRVAAPGKGTKPIVVPG